MPKGGSRRRSIGRERHKGSSRDRKRARKSPANDSIGNTRGTPRPRYTENTQTTTPGVQPEEWICDESEESFCEPGLENAQLNYGKEVRLFPSGPTQNPFSKPAPSGLSSI